MHSYKATQTTFHYSPDFSAGVIITRDDGEELLVLGKDILEFVGYCYVTRKAIDKIKLMDWRELLDQSVSLVQR